MKPSSSEDELRQAGVIAARAMFDASEPIGGDAVSWRYFCEERKCWPPQDDLPADVRRLRVEDTAFQCPRETAECVVYGYRQADGSIAAVQLEALSANGKRLVDWGGRDVKRISRGPVGQCHFAVGGDAKTVGIAEGPTTAMAGSKAFGMPVRASGGAAILSESLLSGIEQAIVLVDRDKAGYARAGKILQAARRIGFRVRVVVAQRGDCEDDLVADIEALLNTGFALDAAWESAMNRTRIGRVRDFDAKIDNDWIMAVVSMFNAAGNDTVLIDQLVKDANAYLRDAQRPNADAQPLSSRTHETVLLAAVFDENNEPARVEELLRGLRASDFSSPAHEAVRLACVAAMQRDRRPTIPIIEKILTDRAALKPPVEVVLDEVDERRAPSADAVEDALAAVKDIARKRALYDLGQAIGNDVLAAGEKSFAELLGVFQKRITTLAESEDAYDSVAPKVHTAWSEKPPPREWIIPGWLPTGRLVLFVGEGGRGKSRLAAQLGAAIATGKRAWLPSDPDPKSVLPDPPKIVRARQEGESDEEYMRAFADTSDQHFPAKVVYWGAEDERAEVNRRLVDMCSGDAKDSIVFNDIEDNFHFIPAMSSGPLWAPNPEDRWALGEITPHGLWLRRYCEVHKPRLLIIDPLVSAFGCNENARAEVRLFANSWDGWAIRHGISILIVAHPAKASNSEYSGSSDWWSAVRNLWSFGLRTATGKVPQPNEDSESAPRLQCSKANYAGEQGMFWIRRGRGMWGTCTFEEAAKSAAWDPAPAAGSQSRQSNWAPA